MVITPVHAQLQIQVGLIKGRLQLIWPELYFQKRVRITLIDQDEPIKGGGLYQFTGIPLSPVCSVRAQVSGKGFFSPRALHGVSDWGKSGAGAKYFGMFQGADQGAMASHRMARDSETIRVATEFSADDFR